MIDGTMGGGIARTIIARRGLLWRSRGASVRLLVGSTTGQESGAPNVGIRNPVMVSEFIQLVTPK